MSGRVIPHGAEPAYCVASGNENDHLPFCSYLTHHQTKLMNTDTLKSPPINYQPEAAKEAAQRAADAVKEAAQRVTDDSRDVAHRATDAVKDIAQRATDATKEAAQHASDAAKEICHTVSVKAEDAMVRTKEYVRENPVPALLGALAFGAALGYMIVMTRRHEPTFRERYVNEPLHTAREAIYAVLAPVAQRLHEGYDSARDGAGKALDKMHEFHPSRAVDSWSGQLRRVGSNLKFW